MNIQVTGKHVDVGEALRTRVETELSGGISKYFERGGDADVTFAKEGYMFKADCLVRLASGQSLIAHGVGGDAHSAFDSLLQHIEARVRRYKRRLKNHHAPVRQELATVTVLRASDITDDDDIDDGLDPAAPPSAMVIAETEAPLKTMTVSAAVIEMELSNYPVILFRNAAHGGLSVIYRRPDGNIGWIDPERTARSKVA